MSYKSEQDKPLSIVLNEALERIALLETKVQTLENDLRFVESYGRSKSNKTQPTGSQLKILKFLTENEDSFTIEDIKSGTKLAKSTISIGLRNLIDIGAVQRFPSISDNTRYIYVPANEMPPEIKRMMELSKCETNS